VLSDLRLFKKISSANNEHSNKSEWYKENSQKILTDVSKLYGAESTGSLILGEIGEIFFPHFSMGSINSEKLFNLDELIMTSYYYSSRQKYKKILDLGANIGLHTLLCKKLGFEVVSYEPDLIHLAQFEKVMKLNGLSTEGMTPKAISDKCATMDYIRILGNTTGSHLLGSKDEIFGPTETITVEVDDILEVLDKGQFDFVKMDVEGHEAVLLNRITAQSIANTDIMLEIGSEKNAKEIFTILTDKKILAYAQKINWGRVEKLEDLPSHHTHGSLFLSMQGPPNWD
jgi:FkbM family methyltransferase